MQYNIRAATAHCIDMSFYREKPEDAHKQQLHFVFCLTSLCTNACTTLTNTHCAYKHTRSGTQNIEQGQSYVLQYMILGLADI